MLKHEYKEVGEKLRDMLIDEYLRANPGVTRSQVVTRNVDGKVVCETIVSSMRNISRITRFQGSDDDREFLDKQLQVSGNVRYQACKKSIVYCEGMIDSLVSSKYCEFSETDRVDNIRFLERSERLAVERGHVVDETKKELVGMMGGEITKHTKLQLAPSRVRHTLTKYVRALADQMKTQASVFRREYDLGDRFSAFTRDFIKDHVQDAQKMASKETMDTILRAYLLARKEDEELPETQGEGPKKLKTALAGIQKRLDKRRIHIQVMEKIVAYLEKVIGALENYQEDGAQGGAGPRMTRSARSTRRARR